MSQMEPSADLTWTAADGASLRGYAFGDPNAAPERSVLVVCGAFLPALVYSRFAAALIARLGDDWAVYVYDRRGKGESAPVDESYDLDTEIGDVFTGLANSGARHLFGHSLGGAIVLHSIRTLGATADAELRALLPETATVFDPAVNVDGSIDTSWVAEFRDRVDRGQLGRAMTLVERNLGMSRALSHAPDWMVAGALAISLRTGIGRASRELFPAGVAELAAVLDTENTAADFAGLSPAPIVMTGGRSADYFRATAAALSAPAGGPQIVVCRREVHGSVPLAKRRVIEALARLLGAPRSRRGGRG